VVGKKFFAPGVLKKINNVVKPPRPPFFKSPPPGKKKKKRKFLAGGVFGEKNVWGVKILGKKKKPPPAPQKKKKSPRGSPTLSCRGPLTISGF